MKLLKQLVVFLLFVFIYYLLGYLNYSRALKIAITGFFLIGFFKALRDYYNRKIFDYILFFIIVAVFLNMGFHGILRDIFGVAQDDFIIMQAIVNTDFNESTEFFMQYKWYLLKHILLISLFMFLYMKFIISKESVQSKKYVIIFGVLLIVLHLNPTMRRADPFIYFFYYYDKYLQQMKQIKNLQKKLNENLNRQKIKVTYYGPKKNVIVWVIGESDTKYDWSLYGYKRNTNRYLEKIKNEIYAVSNVRAAAPSTIPAFEKMLTDATNKNPNLWIKTPSVVMLAKMAGYKTYWISNQITDKTGELSVFANSADVFISTNKGRARGEGSYDEIVLKPFKKILNENVDKKFIIIHLMGSHPAYDFRYPKKFSIYHGFDDEVMQDLLKKGRAKWALIFRNLYDNSIVYSDYIRYSIIKDIKNSKDANHTIFVYNPDHGEDVCHNSNYSGHNFKAIQQWEIPLILWPKKDFNNSIVNKKMNLENENKFILKLLKIKYTH